MTDAHVRLWGKNIGAVSWLSDRQIGVFQYEPDFLASGIQLAPVTMPLRADPYEFPGLPRDAFKGLPGLLADSLPDKFGNALIDAWLAQQSRSAASFNPVERLCYIGTRGMGALEFHPVIAQGQKGSRAVEIDALVTLANMVLNNREHLSGVLTGDDDHETLQDILRVGTSAGGARAKAVLAWNQKTGEFRSGQIKAGEGFTYWLMKFDGISNNRDKELADPQGFGRIEYSFYLLAKAAGIDMTECRLHVEGGRAHFMTHRFDRTETGQKVHMQSLAAMRHYDFNAAGIYSYEQAVETIRMLDLPQYDIEQQFRRSVFNVLIRNQDDHVKNIAFLMNRKGQWRLSPAFDVCYAYNPSGPWTSTHQMSLNGKRDTFELDDLLAFGEFCGIKRPAADKLVRDIHEVVETWPDLAEEAGVDADSVRRIRNTMRRELVIPQKAKPPASRIQRPGELFVGVRDMADRPVTNAQVTLQAANGTTTDGKTDAAGRCQIDVPTTGHFTLLIAHPGHPGEIIDEVEPAIPVSIVMKDEQDTGSLIVHSTGHLPGLKGRLNPILDTSNRTYLYAENIAVDGGKPQPTPFTIGEPNTLEDASGIKIQLTVRHIAGQVALLDYVRIGVA